MAERSRGKPSYASMREPMPYKFNEPRRHGNPTTKYRVTNWPDYDAALSRRGALTVWFTDEAIAEWRVMVRRSTMLWPNNTQRPRSERRRHSGAVQRRGLR